MHGLGNDFIVIDGRFLNKINYKALALKYCERNFGIGADGIIVLEKSKTADFKMVIYNADGSRPEMCGNGLRCLAKYIHDKDLSKKNILTIDTDSGIKTAKLYLSSTGSRRALARANIKTVEISLGEPLFDPRLIPVLNPVAAGFSPRSINLPLKINNQTFKINCVSMGNPHCVIFTKLGTHPNFAVLGQISNHPIFPKKTNVEFVEIVSKNHINVFVYERGVGATLACGTGAAAAAVISILIKDLNRKLKVTLLGGDLLVHWDKKNNEVYLTDPAETVFEGIIRD